MDFEQYDFKTRTNLVNNAEKTLGTTMKHCRTPPDNVSERYGPVSGPYGRARCDFDGSGSKSNGCPREV